VEEACGLQAACALLKVSPRPLPRGQAEGEVKADGRKAAARMPANRLSQAERHRILKVAHRPAFASQPPGQSLAAQGESLAWESSFYRVLGAQAQLAHRDKAKAPTPSRLQPLRARGPAQLWSWEITYWISPGAAMFFYALPHPRGLESPERRGEVYAEQSSDPAAEGFRKAPLREGGEITRGSCPLTTAPP
jgi:hypothetical protein